MLDIRYIVGSLIITVAVIAFFASLILPIDRNPNASASLKPRIEPSKVAEPAPAQIPAATAAPQAPKQAIAPVAQPAPKQAVAPAPVPAKEAATPAPAPAGPKQPMAQAQPPANETTGSIGETKPAAKPAPRRIVQPKKEEPAFQFPWFKGFGQQ